MVIYCVVGIVIFAVAGVAGALHGTVGAIVVLLPIAGLTALALRATQLSAVTSRDSLVVRNWMSTRSFTHSSVSGFRIGAYFLWPGRSTAIQVVTRNGETHAIAVSSAPWYIRRQQQKQWLEQLDAWRSLSGPV